MRCQNVVLIFTNMYVSYVCCTPSGTSCEAERTNNHLTLSLKRL